MLSAYVSVRPRLLGWSWKVRFVYNDVTLTGWALRQSKAYRAAFRAVPS